MTTKYRRSSLEELEWLAFHRPDRAAETGREHLATLPHDSPHRIPLYLQVATALAQGEQLDEAGKILDRIEREVKVAPELQIRARLVRAHVMIRQGNPEGAAATLSDVIVMASGEKLDDRVLQAMSLRAKALALIGKGIEALRIALHVRDAVGEEASPELRFHAAEAVGFVYTVHRDRERAQEPYRKALHIARSLKQDVRIAGSAANLGSDCTSLGLLDEGLCLLKEAEEAALRADCMRLVVFAIWKLAYNYIDRKDLAEARSTVDRGLRHVERLTDTMETASILLLKAQILLHCGRKEEGLQQGEQALRLAERIRNQDIELAVLATLAPHWEEVGRTTDAIDAYKRILAIKRARAERFDPRSLERLALKYELLESGNDSYERRRYDRSFEARQLALRHPELSPIELTVCGGILRGETSHEIADGIALSVHTVDSHRRRIRKKLGLQRGESLHTALLVTAAT